MVITVDRESGCGRIEIDRVDGGYAITSLGGGIPVGLRFTDKEAYQIADAIGSIDAMEPGRSASSREAASTEAAERLRLQQRVAELETALDHAWRKVIAYPFRQVCKHLVASDMLSDMEALGFKVTHAVTHAVVNAHDEDALTHPPIKGPRTMTNKPQNVIRQEHFPVYTAAEIDADERLNIVRFDACEMADGTCGVWDVERDRWIPTYGFEGAVYYACTSAADARQRIAEERSRVVVPMRLGEKPTEPGWYVISILGRHEIIKYGVIEGGVLGEFDHEGIFVSVSEDGTRFIARIYPERISGGE